MNKEHISKKLRPIAEQVKKLNEDYGKKIKELEASARSALAMEILYETDEKIIIKTHQNSGIIEFRHETTDGNYYYYPLQKGYVNPKNITLKEPRYYTFNYEKARKGGLK